MKLEQVAAQLYTIRDYLKTPDEIDASMKKIRDIGYPAVQVSGMGPIPEADLMAILGKYGLTCCATHEGTDAILNTTDSVIARLKALSCKYTAVPHPGNLIGNTMESMTAFCEAMDKAGKAMADAGLVLTYHNHNNEFQKIGGKTILEWIYELTDAANLQGEIDTYWVQAGGGNPAAWCHTLYSRLPLLHLKDYGVNEQNQGCFREVGYGNLDWDDILESAADAGCEWYIVEQDANWTDNDPFKSLEMSFEFLNENYIE